MARLFIFAIGGTGARTLKSLAMLLASGVRPSSKEHFEIVPIIIDPHRSNDDLKRTVRLLDNYQSITEIAGIQNGFFSTKITTLDRLVDSETRLKGEFTFNLQQVANTRFRDYIDFNQLSTEGKALSELLFSGKSINKRGEQVDLLDIEMDIGFVGNPNLGSVVLNQFKESEEFREIASNFTANDRIFIVSSIFGGTGAAGFPAVLKNIRGAALNNNIDSKGFLKNARIGAVSVLPYFNIEKDPASPIQKSDFIAKSKAALYYYDANVTGNKSVNALYYLADDFGGKPYKNDPGENGQQNAAHFIELIAAYSIIDFMGIPAGELTTEDGKAIKPIYKEFGLKKDSVLVTFDDLEATTEHNLALPLSQFSLFQKYLLEHLDDVLHVQAWTNDPPAIDRKFLNDTFYRSHLKEFLDAFTAWLKEMAANSRAFGPFNPDSALNTFIEGRAVKTGIFSKGVDYASYDHQLNKQSKSAKYDSAPDKMLKLFYDSTKNILTSKYGLKD